MLQCFQLALVTVDLPGTLRLYSEALGFRNAGGQCSWGSRIQGLGADARHLMWWLVGERKFFQLEVFEYTHPVPRPLPPDWRPCDHGWTRFGVAVDDFDACLNGLERRGITPFTAAVATRGHRHVAIRDPYVGVIIEIVESGRSQPQGPNVTYVTSSVSDLESARGFYGGLLQFRILPLEGGTAQARGLPPLGPGHHEYFARARRAEPVARALQRLKAAGYAPPFTFENGENICGYITDPERALAIASIPEQLDAVYGFVAAPLGFMGKHVE